MDMAKMKQQHGLTLIELVIVVAIIGILSAVALPSYRDYVLRGKLADAQTQLSGTRARLEQYYQDNRSYPPQCGGTAAGLPAFTMPAASKYFTLTCATGTTVGQTFLLSAAGIAAGGTAGFTFTIDDQGNRNTTAAPTADGWATATGCWVARKPSYC
jgi:type IV pilus assembly protein PilE